MMTKKMKVGLGRIKFRDVDTGAGNELTDRRTFSKNHCLGLRGPNMVQRKSKSPSCTTFTLLYVVFTRTWESKKGNGNDFKNYISPGAQVLIAGITYLRFGFEPIRVIIILNLFFLHRYYSSKKFQTNVFLAAKVYQDCQEIKNLNETFVFPFYASI